jgi:hypothetical protein
MNAQSAWRLKGHAAAALRGIGRVVLPAAFFAALPRQAWIQKRSIADYEEGTPRLCRRRLSFLNQEAQVGTTPTLKAFRSRRTCTPHRIYAPRVGIRLKKIPGRLTNTAGSTYRSRLNPNTPKFQSIPLIQHNVYFFLHRLQASADRLGAGILVTFLLQQLMRDIEGCHDSDAV